MSYRKAEDVLPSESNQVYNFLKKIQDVSLIWLEQRS